MRLLIVTAANESFAPLLKNLVDSLFQWGPLKQAELGVLDLDLSPETLKWLVALSFFAFGLWALKPDELEENPSMPSAGVFLTTLVVFFLVEMGDKTQLATIALAARYDSLVSVVLGTTLGMMIANAPAVWMGEKLAHRVNMRYMRWVAAALFFLLGALTLLLR